MICLMWKNECIGSQILKSMVLDLIVFDFVFPFSESQGIRALIFGFAASPISRS